MKKKILVTGAAGAIGSLLVKALIAEGHTVVGIDNLSAGRISNIKGLPDEHFFYLEMDVCSPKVLTQKELFNVSEIYHLASLESPSFYKAFPFESIAANTTGTKNMLELAKRTNAKMIFTSTNAVTVLPEWFEENGRTHLNDWGPDACYIEAKRLGEVLCFLYFKHYQTKVQVARIYNKHAASWTVHDLHKFHLVIIKKLQQLMEYEEAFGEIINIENTRDATPPLEQSFQQIPSEYEPQPDDSTKVGEKQNETKVINNTSEDIHIIHEFINNLTKLMHKKQN
jgi:UDP-glucose 4-epimerase